MKTDPQSPSKSRHSILEFARDLEDWHLPFSEGNYLARAGIPGGSGLPGDNLESAESSYLDVLAFFKSCLDGCNEVREDLSSLFSGKTSPCSNLLDDISLSHRRPLVTLLPDCPIYLTGATYVKQKSYVNRES